MHVDAVKKGDKALIVDDLIATGGTVGCIADMIEKLGAEVSGSLFLVELTELDGRKKLEKKGIKVDSVVEI